MNKIIQRVSSFNVFILLGSILAFTASAEVTTEGNICRNTDVIVDFFNGVNTTPSGANSAKEEN